MAVEAVVQLLGRILAALAVATEDQMEMAPHLALLQHNPVLAPVVLVMLVAAIVVIMVVEVVEERERLGLSRAVTVEPTLF